MPALRPCRHCRTPFPVANRSVTTAYCSAECESAHEQQCRANVEKGNEKRRSKQRAYNQRRRGVPVAAEVPKVVKPWAEMTALEMAEYIRANGPGLGE